MVCNRAVAFRKVGGRFERRDELSGNRSLSDSGLQRQLYLPGFSLPCVCVCVCVLVCDSLVDTLGEQISLVNR